MLNVCRTPGPTACLKLCLSSCVVVEAVFPYHYLKTLLLLHFIIIQGVVAILAVVLHIFIPFIRANQTAGPHLFMGEWSELD